MGFDLQGIKFLLAAQRSGVSFARTATLGRQEMFINQRHLRRVLRGFSVPDSEASARRILDASDGFAEPLLRWLGSEQIISIDASGYESASVVHDLNLPIPQGLKEAFSVVIDGGTLEHIFNYPVAIRNCMEMVQQGGHILLMTPANNFMGHGFYQFSPELFFRIFSEENGFEMNRAIFSETATDAQWYEIIDPARAKRRVELTNSRPAYLLIQARKVRQAPILATPPQQSDYRVLWQEAGTRSATSRVNPPFATRVLHGISRRLQAAYRRVEPAGLAARRQRPDSEVFIQVSWQSQNGSGRAE
jgi:hypothetical protein